MVVIVLFASFAFNVHATVPIYENNYSKFTLGGYLRTGIGASEGDKTQAAFQLPGAENKYCLGNQTESYGELQFAYQFFLNKAKTQSIEAIWMTSYQEPFGDTTNQMMYNQTEELYMRVNNLFGLKTSLWAGRRYVDRRGIHVLDRFWINPGQGGWGFGFENNLQKGTDEDIQWGVWRFEDESVNSFEHFKTIASGQGTVFSHDETTADMFSYISDMRWVNRPISETLKANVSLSFAYRPKNEALGYENKSGVGAAAWLDYASGVYTNTTAFVFRQGANIPTHHWTGLTARENRANDNVITNDLDASYYFELSNEYLYDDKEHFALNLITLAEYRDFGATPYVYDASNPNNSSNLSVNAVNGKAGTGSHLLWLTVAARTHYYICDNLRLTTELSTEYINNEQIDASGFLSRLTFSPELALHKGFWSRPVIRPMVSYAMWSQDLKGFVGTGPGTAPFADNTSGFTYGVQFEYWW